jgi:hypothetical protein
LTPEEKIEIKFKRMSFCGCFGSSNGIDDIDEAAGYDGTYSSSPYYRSPSPLSDADAQGVGGIIDDDASAFGTNYSCSEYERSIRRPQSSTIDSVLPTWMNDKDANFCWGCETPFNEVSMIGGWSQNLLLAAKKSDKGRRHHCRRCRNVFCGTCTSSTATILLTQECIDNNNKSDGGGNHSSSALKEVRVCDNCYKEIPIENEFLRFQRPMLLKGEFFKKQNFLSRSSIVRLMLSIDSFSLIMDTTKQIEDFEPENNSGNNIKRKLLPLSALVSVHMKKLTRMEIELSDGKLYAIDADTINTVQNWVSALKVASERARQGSLKNRIELERRQKVEAVRRNDEAAIKHEILAKKRAHTKQERDTMKHKYDKVRK